MKILYPLNIINLIKEEIELIDETYTSIQEVKKLGNELLKNVALNNLEIIKKDGQFKYLYGLHLKNVNNIMDYKDLRGFINRLNVYISFVPKDGSGDKGEYSVIKYKTKEKFKHQDEREINIYYDYNYIKDKIEDKLQIKGDNFTDHDLYLILYNEMYSTIIHELQHAYDDYRSRGMSYNTKEFNKYREKYMSQIANNFHQKTIDNYEHLKDYYNLPHEIWARFTQTIHDIKFMDLDFPEDENGNMYMKYNMYPIKDIVKKFTNKFNGYSVLTDKMKRKLINKVVQFWHYEQERLPELNDKLKKESLS